MSWFVFLIVIGTTIWVGIDSSNLIRDIPKEDRKRLGTMSTVEWVLGCILLWIVFFPWYLAKRSKYIRFLESSKNRPKQCPSCLKYYDGQPSFCPNCGAKLIN